MPATSSPGWQTLHAEVLCDTPYLRVHREQVATPTRPKGVAWMVVRRPTAAEVAPRTPDGKFLLVRQERIAVQRLLWEFPAGQVDGAVDEVAIRATALRELGEEAGVHCTGELISMGSFFSSPGFTDEWCHLFLATGVVPRPEGSDHDEHEAILEVAAFSVEELRAMIAGGEIIDANTLALYARMHAKGLIS